MDQGSIFHGLSSAPKRVCMVTHSFYESDNRVMRYAQTLAAKGFEVDVFALRRSPEMPKEEVIEGVRILRIKDRFGKTEQSKASFLWPLLRFFAAASWSIFRKNRRCRYDLVHAHNIPDFIIYAAWHPKLTGARLILDIHDLVPELFASKFNDSASSPPARALQWMEKASAAFADHVILASHLWLDKYTARSAPAQKCSVFINNVDARVFRPRVDSSPNENFLLLFPGSLQWHQGVDIAIRAFAKLRLRLPRSEFHIYGDGILKPKLVELVAELGLSGCVRFFAPLKLHEIAQVMARADLGVVPKRADSFGNEAYSTKIMEFMAAGVPVVASRTKVDSYYFDDSVLRFFESGNIDALADAMHEVLVDGKLRRSLIAHASAYAELHSWEKSKQAYLQLVERLLCGNRESLC
ncbi:MAG: glycosyltransferase family 4 protein [Verrucomicrobia bacterium]|nr:glycosyltransferase family 4 protein [Verrucomicrobiota bacterium]